MTLNRWSRSVLEPTLLFTVVFAPWAFGCTGGITEWILVALGWTLGLIGFFARSESAAPLLRLHRSQWMFVVLGVCFLTYVLISALNSRATSEITSNGVTLKYRVCIDWLPHSYDAPNTWAGLGKLLSVAGILLATWRWLSIPVAYDASESRTQVLPRQLARLIWVLTVSSALLAVVSIAQRLSHTDNLLFLKARVLPGGGIDGKSSFGPYAYQSNAAQYFNLVWPLTLGFWWCHQQRIWELTGARPRFGATPHSVLPFCAALMVACPFLATTRAGSAVCVAQLTAVVVWVLFRGKNLPAYIRFGVIGGLGLAVIIAFSSGISDLWIKFGKFKEGMVDREAIRETAHRMIEEFDPWGSGSQTFRSLSDLYTDPSEPKWQAFVHDDWLEAHLSYGWVGFAMILGLLALWLFSWVNGPWLRVPRNFSVFIALSLTGLLAHARFDLPFQIFSLHVIFAILAVVASVCPPAWVAGTRRRITSSSADTLDAGPAQLAPDLSPNAGVIEAMPVSRASAPALGERVSPVESLGSNDDTQRKRSKRRQKKGATPVRNVWRRFLDRIADPRPNLVHLSLVIAVGIVIYLLFSHSMGKGFLPGAEVPPDLPEQSQP